MKTMNLHICYFFFPTSIQYPEIVTEKNYDVIPELGVCQANE
jgi:hypothetical protein